MVEAFLSQDHDQVRLRPGSTYGISITVSPIDKIEVF
jgi:hypothetical protein